MSEAKDAAPAAAQESDAKAAEAAAEKDGGADAAPADGAEQPEAEAAAEVEAADEAPGEEQPVEEEAAEEPAPEDPLATAAADIADLKDKLLRAMAETENVRRRSARERAEAEKFAIANFARDMLGVADNLRRAIESVPEEARQENEALASLLDGVELTERELAAVLERHGLRPIEAMGRKFDHNWHQAVFEVEDPSQPPGTVVQVMQTGYAIAERLLRPAMVGLAKGAKDEDDDEEGQKVDTTV